MDDALMQLRRRAANAARAVLAKETSFHDFITEFGTSKDAGVEELVDLLTHEPQRGGWLGASEEDWWTNRWEIVAAIEALEK